MGGPWQIPSIPQCRSLAQSCLGPLAHFSPALGGFGAPETLFDGNGVKLGRFLGTTKTSFNPKIILEIMTSTGYLVQFKEQGVKQAELSTWATCYSEPNCTGTAMTLSQPCQWPHFAVQFLPDTHLAAPPS